MLSNRQKSIFAKILLFVSTIIWGSSYFIIKNALDEVPVYFLLSMRFFISAVLLCIVFAKRLKKLNAKYLLAGSVTGVFLALAYIFQTIGLTYTTPGTGAFLTTIYCVIVPFMMWIINKKAPSIANFAACFLCVLGIGLICVESGGQSANLKGELLVIVCGVFFALQIVAVGVWGQKLDIILYTIVQFFVAFVICGILSVICEDVPKGMSSQAIWSVLYLSVFATCLCFVLMNVGIKHTSTISSSIILSLEAVFGVAFSMLFYDEKLSVRSAIGFAIIFAAIILNEVVPSLVDKKRWAKSNNDNNTENGETKDDVKSDSGFDSIEVGNIIDDMSGDIKDDLSAKSDKINIDN